MVNVAGVAVKLGYFVQPSDTNAGAAISPAVKVAVQDANGFTITSSSAAVTIAIGNNPGSSTLSGTLTRNAVNGVATFGDLSLNHTGSGYTLTANSGSLTQATSAGFNIAPGAAAQLVFVVQPHNTDANAVISPPVQVAIEDSLGNTVSTTTAPITIALHDNPGVGTLSGTLLRSAVNGVAVFDDLSINRVANNYTLHANASGLPQVVSASFNIGRPVLVVTNTNDSGAGSLRQAINDADNLFGADTIHFNIAGTPPFTIKPTSLLPTISESITIDGTSQTGFSGTPIIELSGVNIANGRGLTLNGDDCTVKGLVINQFSIAISVQTSGNVIQGNYLGVDVSGTVAKATNTGINIIGLTTPTNNTIGGTTVAARNVIVGSNAGISISSSNFGADPSSSLIQGNFIGTNAAGTAALAGAASTGISLLATNNTVGGTTPGARNVISGNGTGVKILGDFNTIQGNFIGTDLNGSSPLGNIVNGIAVFGSDNLVGGATPQAANTIAFNATGVVVADAFGPAQRNAIRQNSIFSNAKLGIDLQTSGATGITGDDPGDGDSGANNLQNFPVLSSAVSSAGSLIIQGTLNSKASSTYTLDFYSNQTCNGLGNGEGKTYLGSSTVNTDSSGIVAFAANLSVNVAVGQVVTATATDSVGNTSEFSKCTIVSPSIVSISGHLSDSSNVALVNTLVTISGTKTTQTVTNGLGNYRFINLPSAGTYTVTPVLANYIFAPPNRTYSNLLADQTNQNFVGTRNNLTISGTVKSQVQTTLSPLSGVTVTLSGAASAVTTTDNNGSYSFKNLLAGSYTVTPGKPGFTMTPPSSPVTLTNGDKLATFTAQISLTGRIVFTSNGQLDAMNADGSGLVKLLTPFDFDPALSRDGQRIAFVQRTSGDPATDEIFVADSDGSNVMRLTMNNVSDVQPAWSPDGTKIAFIRNATLLVMNAADGTGQTSVPFSGNGQGVNNPTWSPDGSKIAFAMNVSGTSKVFRADYPSGSNLTLLATNATVPDWSPDGMKIVFARNSNVLTMNAADGSNQTQVIASVGLTEPVWSPDSSQFAYAHLNVVGQTEVIVSSADGTIKTIVNTSSSFIDKPGLVNRSRGVDCGWLATHGAGHSKSGRNVYNLQRCFRKRYNHGFADTTELSRHAARWVRHW